MPIASLHTDHVAADNARAANYVFASQQLLPPSRVPGFIFHQTERADENGTSACFAGTARCYDMNARDFDLIGFKYSLISSIGSAGLNNVLAMIPARDAQEFTLLPSADRAFIARWLAFTDVHIRALGHAAPIPTLPPPSLASIDGWHAFANDSHGLLFLFNPAPNARNVSLTVDESIGISNASAAHCWDANELYPVDDAPAPLGGPAWRHGSVVVLWLAGSEARVIQLSQRDAACEHDDGERIGASDGSDEDSDEDAAVASAVARAVTIECPLPEGLATARMPPIFVPPAGNTGGSFTFAFRISGAVLAQLRRREAAYPVEWTASDAKATWLMPARLLASIFIDEPDDVWSEEMTATLDGTPERAGTPLLVRRSYNSRGLPQDNTFLGFYIDLTPHVTREDEAHLLKLRMPSFLPPGAFRGVFLVNVEAEGGDRPRCRLG